jgi:hypothetical protein
MKRSSANPIKTLGGIDSYATSQDQFAVERDMCYKSDTVALQSMIIGIADVALRYNTICRRCHIYQTLPSKRTPFPPFLFTVDHGQDCAHCPYC